MAAFSKEQIQQLKQSVTRLKQLTQAVMEITEDKRITENRIRLQYKQLQANVVDRILEDMDIEKINIDKDGIRVSALQSKGICNVFQVSRMSLQQLQTIEGIGEATATKIETNVKLIRMSVEKNASVTLSLEQSAVGGNTLISDLYYLIQNDAVFKNAQSLFDVYYDKIHRDLPNVGVLFSSLKLFFSSKERKQAAYDAAQRLLQIDQGDFGKNAPDVILAYNAGKDKSQNPFTTSTGKMFGAQIKPIGGSVSPSGISVEMDSNTAFRQNSAPFYAMLENVLGSSYAKAVETGVNALPEELLQSIDNVSLNTQKLKATLRRYQVFGTKYILHQQRVLLGDEMGLGKTMQALAAFCHLAANGGTHFLVVCPLSVVVNWKREVESQTDLTVIEIYGNDREEEMSVWVQQGGVAITSFETLNKVPVPVTLDLQMLVVDEAHYVKNPQAIRTKSVMAAATVAKRVLFMSGTPLENRVEEMQFLIQCLQPEVAQKIQHMKQIIQAEEFRNAIASVYLRRVREDVLKELPELVEKEQWGLMNDKEMQAYREALRDGSFMAVRQVSWQLPDVSESTKAQRLMEICEDAKESGRKIIIFSFFKDVLMKVSGMLGQYCIGVIDGSVPASHRQEMIDQLLDAPAGSALVCQIQAGGVGLNIQAASVVVFCEPQIKPSLETQAVARAYRMGQSQSVLVHRLLMDDTVDERVMEILKQKSQLFNSFADESVIGDMDTQINENAVMKDIVAAERKRLGLEPTVAEVENTDIENQEGN